MKRFRFLLWPFALLALIVIGCQESQGHRFAREAEAFTRQQCPKAVNAAGTILLDSLVYRDGDPGELVYCYTVDVSEEEAADLKRQRELRYQHMRTAIRQSIELKRIKEARLTIVHCYLTPNTDTLLLLSYPYEVYR